MQGRPSQSRCERVSPDRNGVETLLRNVFNRQSEFSNPLLSADTACDINTAD
jgi:hypothetical protein